LGLIGLLTVQILRAAGCRVFGIDIAADKIQLGQKLGCAKSFLANDEALDEKILDFTDGYGADATIVTAASSSNQPIEQAAEITRERGRVVVVGLTRMELPREPFYLKELDLRLSRSYGPGRYDKRYEDEGSDYPYAYVRFTERRNMISFLELVEGGQVQLDPLITHRFPIDEAVKAYELLHGAAKEPYLAILLEYSRTAAEIPRRIELRAAPLATEKIVLGVIGAGNYATANLLPVLRNNPAVSLGSVCTGSGITAANVAEKFGFAAADSDLETVMRNSDALLIATRHSEHAELVLRALRHGKPVFVEKPLAISEEQLQEIIDYLESSAHGSLPADARAPSALLMVGFNRRFAPATELIHDHFSSVTGPRQVMIRVNAGAIPPDHWIQDSQTGGGRLIGEGCHFVDLAVALTGSMIEMVTAVALALPNKGAALRDSFSISLAMIDGSVATIIYASAGDTGLAKERVEIFGGGKSAVIDDFRRVELWQGGKKKEKSWTQDKGQRKQMDAWIKGLQQGHSPIPIDEILNVHGACFAALRCIETGTAVRLPTR
jgi:predicted dehydrogenase